MDRRTLLVGLIAAEIAIVVMAIYAIHGPAGWPVANGHAAAAATHVVALPAGGTVTVAVPGTAVTLRASSDGRVHVAERSRHGHFGWNWGTRSEEPPFRVETRADGVHIEHEQSSGVRLVMAVAARESVEISVPPEAPVDVAAARVTAIGLRAPLSIHAGDGSVHVTDHVGDVRILADDGRIYLDRVTAQNIRAESKYGRIIGTALTFHGPAPKLDATTRDGRIEMEVKHLPGDGRYLVHTDNGPIRLRIPSNSDATITMATDDGSITATGAPLSNEGSGRRAVFGNGSATFQATTRDGSINLLAGILE